MEEGAKSKGDPVRSDCRESRRRWNDSHDWFERLDWYDVENGLDGWKSKP